jgi:hypothetical protein
VKRSPGCVASTVASGLDIDMLVVATEFGGKGVSCLWGTVGCAVRCGFRLCALAGLASDGVTGQLCSASRRLTPPPTQLDAPHPLRNQIIGSCIPWFFITYPCYVLNLFIIDLINFAASNSAIGSIRDLYLEARREIRITLSDPALGMPEKLSEGQKAAVAALRAHDSVLSAIKDVDRYRAKFLGYPIHFGVMRWA